MSNRKTYTNEQIIEYFVCGECGGKLSLIKVFHEGEQAYCPDCSKTHTGVLPEVYELAFKYCDSHFFGYYSKTVVSDDEARVRLNRGKMCDIIRWLRPRLAKLTQNGGAQ